MLNPINCTPVCYPQKTLRKIENNTTQPLNPSNEVSFQGKKLVALTAAAFLAAAATGATTLYKAFELNSKHSMAQYPYIEDIKIPVMPAIKTLEVIDNPQFVLIARENLEALGLNPTDFELKQGNIKGLIQEKAAILENLIVKIDKAENLADKVAIAERFGKALGVKDIPRFKETMEAVIKAYEKLKKTQGSEMGTLLFYYLAIAAILALVGIGTLGTHKMSSKKEQSEEQV